jgi:hypothetical protein
MRESERNENYEKSNFAFASSAALLKRRSEAGSPTPAKRKAKNADERENKKIHDLGADHPSQKSYHRNSNSFSSL